MAENTVNTVIDAAVAEPCQEYKDMELLRRIPRVLLGGTQALRAAGEEFLPKNTAESADAYAARLKRSVLFNAFRKAVYQLTGKVFSKPIQVEGADARIEEFIEDIDLQGNALDIFSQDVFTKAVTEGLSFILVDAPAASVDTEQVVSIQEQKESGTRPYFVHIKPQQIIGWRSEMQQGKRVLTQLRIYESVTEATGRFGESAIEQVRVLEPGLWELWRKTDDAWALHDRGTTSLDYIPLVVFNTSPTGYMTADPPLQDLADLNILHWQSSSAQQHILNYTRFPILFGKCLALKEGEAVVIGPNNMIRSENENADLTHVEHTGASIEAGRSSLKDLESQMAFLALEPMLQQDSGNITATKTAVDSSAAASTLMSWAVRLKDSLELALQYMADYIGAEAPGEVHMDFDFVLSLSNVDGQLLLSMFEKGAISRETLISEFQRRGILSDDMDVEADGEMIAEEAEASLEAQARAITTAKNASASQGQEPKEGIKPPAAD